MSRNNIVLVSVDSLRADFCGFMGYDGETTPNLDAMAEEGIVFKNAVSPGPRTPESMPSVFTGEFVADDLPDKMVPQRELISQHMDRHRSIPERLSEMGYTTVGFSPNPFTSRFFGFGQGFDYYQDFIGDSDDGLYQRLFEGWLGGDTVSNILRLARNMIQREEVFKPWEAFYDEAMTTVQSADEPFFLWIFLMDSHEPYLAGDGYRSMSFLERWSAIWQLYLGDKESPFDEETKRRLIQAYEDSVRYTDAFFGQLLEDVDDGDTTVFVHGDHGEAFGEHGVYSHEPYFYEENIHVPLLAYGVGADRIEEPISLRRIPELVMDAANGELAANARDRTEPYAISRTAVDQKVTLRSDSWKYIHGNDEDVIRLVDLDDGALPIDGHENLLKRLARNSEEPIRERRRIADAVDASISEGDIR